LKEGPTLRLQRFVETGNHSMRDHTECALVERLRGRDEHALAELASLYRNKIFQLAFRYVRNHEDAEEVVQDVLLKVFRKIDMFRGDSALSSWIYRITFNTAMSRLRRTKAARLAEVTELEIGASTAEERSSVHDPADSSNLADEEVLKRELRERLLAAVELPPIYREPVILRDFEGLSTEQASTKLRVKDQTLKSRLHRGRMLLREQLADFASGLSMHRPAEAF
jgi:RNA polymerase sigma-70 factor (ECF subfamily)